MIYRDGAFSNLFVDLCLSFFICGRVFEQVVECEGEQAGCLSPRKWLANDVSTPCRLPDEISGQNSER
jgi:hypothetical protein